jgi:hypothetical protein
LADERFFNLQQDSKAIPQPSAAPGAGAESAGSSFGSALEDAIKQGNGLEINSQKEMDNSSTIRTLSLSNIDRIRG